MEEQHGQLAHVQDQVLQRCCFKPLSATTLRVGLLTGPHFIVISLGNTILSEILISENVAPFLDTDYVDGVSLV